MNYEEIREMPLSELLTYYNALKAICDVHENHMRPLYNSKNRNDVEEWTKTNAELQYAKKYLNVVLDSMKYRAFNGLENYKPFTSGSKMKSTYNIDVNSDDNEEID